MILSVREKQKQHVLDIRFFLLHLIVSGLFRDYGLGNVVGFDCSGPCSGNWSSIFTVF